MYAISYMHEDHSSYEAESLAIAYVFVRDSVGMENVGQALLASFLLRC